MHLYENHMGGGVFITEDQLSYEEACCDMCGDRDWEIGEANSIDDVRAILLSSGYSEQYIEEFVAGYFPLESPASNIGN